MRKVGLVLAGALLAGFLGGTAAGFWVSKRQASERQTPVVYLPLREARYQGPPEGGFVEAAHRATPSVVFIRDTASAWRAKTSGALGPVDAPLSVRLYRRLWRRLV
jgi:hypothetical protein